MTSSSVRLVDSSRKKLYESDKKTSFYHIETQDIHALNLNKQDSVLGQCTGSIAGVGEHGGEQVREFFHNRVKAR